MINIEIFKSEDGQINLTDARALHTGLESKKKFADWIKNKVINNPFFTEDEDFTLLPQSVKQKGTGGHNKKDYALTLDTAKKVAMAEQTKIGDEVREAFIQAEKDLQGVKETLKHGITNDLKTVDAIESKYIQKINKGEKRVVMNFIREIVGIKTMDELGNSIAIVKSGIKKEYREWFLEQSRVNFDKMVEELGGKYVLDNTVSILSVKADIEAQNREFARRSKGQQLKQANKEYKRLRRAKDAVTNAYLDQKPKVYTGSFEIIDDEYITDDENVHFVVSLLEFEGEDGPVVFRGGTVVIKNGNLYLDINGGADAVLFRTKARDFDKAEYEANLQLNFDDNTYTVRVYKLK